MATKVQDPQIGQIVYPLGSPLNLGKILRIWEVEKPWGKDIMCEVKQLNGESKEHRAMGLNDFESLVFETEKKARNHRERFEKAKEL